MTGERLYLVDSDVFITAKNLYYSFEICPGFWKCMLHHHRRGRVFSIDRVRSELLAGSRTEDLVRWVHSDVPEAFFLEADTEAVRSVYAEIMLLEPSAATRTVHAGTPGLPALNGNRSRMP